jgi:hypothetical protein
MLGVMKRIPAVNRKELTNAASSARTHRVHGPSVEDIRARAYAIHLANGAQPGHEAEDWAAAERELRASLQIALR